jgi:hypothetical protein
VPGYRNRIITLDFPDLCEEGDSVTVTLRNPQSVPFDTLQPREVNRDAQGNALDPKDAALAQYEVYAKLVVNWRVYDASAESDDQPLLGSPATGELFARLPLAIQEKIAEAVNNARNPTRTPATPTS